MINLTGEEPIVEQILRKKNIIMDATLLNALQACPRYLDLRYNHRFRSNNGNSNSLECGLIVHKVLEIYNKLIISGAKRDYAIAGGLAAGEMFVRSCPHCTGFIPTDAQPKPPCGHQPDEYPGVKNTPVDSEQYKVGWRWALNTCEQYFDRWKNDHWVPLEAEVVKGQVVYEDDEIRVLWKAKLDLMADTNQGIYPVDHKTMKQKRDIIELNNQFKGQCLVTNTRRVMINRIGFQTSLKPEEKFVREPMTYSDDAIAEFQQEIIPYYAYRLMEYHEMQHWPPNYTHCENKYGNCVFIGVCGADRHMRQEEIRMNFYVGPEWNPTNDED